MFQKHKQLFFNTVKGNYIYKILDFMSDSFKKYIQTYAYVGGRKVEIFTTSLYLENRRKQTKMNLYFLNDVQGF